MGSVSLNGLGSNQANMGNETRYDHAVDPRVWRLPLDSVDEIQMFITRSDFIRTDVVVGPKVAGYPRVFRGAILIARVRVKL